MIGAVLPKNIDFLDNPDYPSFRDFEESGRPSRHREVEEG